MVKLGFRRIHKVSPGILFIVVILVALTIVTIHYLSRFDSNCSIKIGEPTTSENCLQKIVDRTRKCLLDNLRLKTPEQVWFYLNSIIDKCTHFLRKTSNYIKLNNKEDYKFMILPVGVKDEQIKHQECTLLALGIGDDIEAEKQVKNYFPNCSFIGADPSYESGKIFQDIGQFFNIAVTNRNGTVISLVFEKRKYFRKVVSTIDFYTMLQYTNTTNIDFLFLDIEGGEYSILPLLTRKRLKNYQLCQVSLELHYSYEMSYGMGAEKFMQLIRNLLEESNYLPIVGEYVTDDKFNRMFWVDYTSKFCVDKYFNDFCTYNR